MDEALKKYDLSPNQYFFLSSIFYRTRPMKIHDDEVKELLQRSFFVRDATGIYLTDKSKTIFNGGKDLKELFTIIWDLYPKKTPNGRLLRPLSMDSQIGSKAFNKIKKHLSVHKTYKEILNGLKNELNIRDKNRSLNYMHHINTWINRQEWESYADENEEEESNIFDMG